MPSRLSSAQLYTVGWITALDKELAAAMAILDEKHLKPSNFAKHPRDTNTYAWGRIGEHNVVIASLASGSYGTVSAATTAGNMVSSLPHLRFGLMVGIGAGIPRLEDDVDIRLGDVVVGHPTGTSSGLVQYDLGKQKSNGKFERVGYLNPPPEVLLKGLKMLRANYLMEESRIPDILEDMIRRYPRMKDPAPNEVAGFVHQGAHNDRLFQASSVHNDAATGDSQATELDNVCAYCDPAKEVKRKERSPSPMIHYGTIASGNTVIKDGASRDEVLRRFDDKCICFEMEAAGLMMNFPCLVIRGICDYADTHKNDRWQYYAAATAAAFAKELLETMDGEDVDRTPPVEETIKEIIQELSATSTKADEIIRYHQTEEQKEILNWLTPVDYGSQQSDYISRRESGTGQWLFESAKFRDWLKDKQQTFFCPGIPGAGKTFLSAAVVDHLQELYSDNRSVGIAYFYCNFQRQEEQTAQDLLASLLKQLTQSLQSFPDIVQKLHQKHKDRRSRPSFDELSNTIQSVAGCFSRVFILIDALDELRVSDGRLTKFIAEVLRIQAKSGANIFATARPIPGIMNHFKNCLSHEVIATEEDVRKYLRNNMCRMPDCVLKDPNLQEEVESVIVRNVQGMFLLAYLHFKPLTDMVSVKEIRTALLNLPSGSNVYDDTYETAMERIEQQAARRRELAKRVLSWITCAKRPLSTVELQHALAVEIGESELDTDNLPDLGVMVQVCAGLVTVDEHSNIIRLVHYTAQQYFDQKQQKWFPDAATDISMTCLAYLTFGTFDSGLCETDEEFEARLKLNPLYDYASKFWGQHAQVALSSSQTTNRLLQSATRFFLAETKIQAARQAMMAVKHGAQHSGYSQQVPRKTLGLHLAAYFGLHQPAATYFEQPDILDTKDSYGRTPLLHAAERGQRDMAKLLLDTGRVDVNSQDNYGRTSLSWAADHGHENVVNLLLGVDGLHVDLADQDRRAPLWVAVQRGYGSIVRTLLQTGKANVDLEDRYGLTPLQCAVQNGHEAVVKILIEIGEADLSLGTELLISTAVQSGYQGILKMLINATKSKIDLTDQNGKRPVHHAAKIGHEGIMVMLLEAGVTNMADNEGRTPLHYAAQNGHEGIIKLLLEAGIASIDSTDHAGQNSLHYAAQNSHEAVIKLLLEAGPTNVDSANNKGQTPLNYAAREHHEGIVKLLLETNEVNPDSEDCYGKTALYYAASNGYEKIVELLLGTGKANVDVRDRDGQTPLFHAAMHGHENVVKMLLQTGKQNPDAFDREGRTPLHYAVQREHEAVVKVLLEFGKADADLADGEGRTPLDVAADRDCEGIVKVLLEIGKANLGIDSEGRMPLFDRAIRKGYGGVVRELLQTGKVDVDVTNSDGWIPLHYAARNGHERMVKVLLETGNASVDLVDGNGWTPLLYAVRNGHEAAVKELLATDRANADLADLKGETPLLHAIENGHEAIVRMLLEVGKANVNLADNDGWTPLQSAVWHGHEGAVKALLESGKANTNLGDNDGQTLLFYAIQNGHEAVVKLLLDTGLARTNMTNQDGETPVQVATRIGDMDIVKVLLDTGEVDGEFADGDGWTSLLFDAAQRGHEALVRLLLEAGNVKVDSVDSDGYTPLLHATENGHVGVVKLLLEIGHACVDWKDNQGWTPLLYAITARHEDMVKLLLYTGKADPSLQNNDMPTPLAFASSSGYKDMVKLLLDTGRVNADLADGDGQTPLFQAAENGHEGVVKMLLATGKVNTMAADKYGRTPEQMATMNGYERIAKRLSSQP